MHLIVAFEKRTFELIGVLFEIAQYATKSLVGTYKHVRRRTHPSNWDGCTTRNGASPMD